MTALEEMGAFFAARLEGYDEHMLTELEGAAEFYPLTASLLPLGREADILDLGCGTGLELEAYYRLGGEASIVGIDLSAPMLDALKSKLADRDVKLVNASYFDVDLGEGCFDAVVSIESLHHFTAKRKLGLYKRIRRALKPGGNLVLTDYFAESERMESRYARELERLVSEQGLDPDRSYHYDIPLTVDHEIEMLRAVGFENVRIEGRWGATCTIRAS